MKILFVYPNRSGTGNVPLSIPILQAALKQNGHKVKIFDISDYRKYMETMLEFLRVGQFKTTGKEEERASKLKTSDPYEDLDKLVQKYKPDLIGVNSLSTDFKFACGLVSGVKETYQIPVAFGGIHVITNREKSIQEKSIDFMCIGEGEEAFPELCNKIEAGKDYKTIKGFWIKENGKIYRNEMRPLIDIDTAPYMDFEGFNPIHFMRPFDGKMYKMINYETSRGCPFSCTYCVNSTMRNKIYKGLGKYHRLKSIERTIDELEFLVKKYGFNFIRFWDEDFTTHRTDYLKELAKEYIDRVNLPFLIYSRPESIKNEKIKILKKMGCKTFALGIESGDEWMRRNVLNRQLSDETLIEKFKMIRKNGIRVSAYNIIGLPFETRERIFRTIELNRRCKTDLSSVGFLEPYQNTPIREMAEKEGLVDPDYIPEAFVSKPHFIPKDFTREELMGLFRTFPLYVTMPKHFFPLIKIAETDDKMYDSLFNIYTTKYMK
jgi:radical SAM superfamily enzyme YgiQ (UPF0313 family)